MYHAVLCFCKTGTDVTQFYDGDMDAVHRPMPELPPVTMTTLLFSPAMIFPPENVDLVRVYRIARRLSIRIAGL